MIVEHFFVSASLFILSLLCQTSSFSTAGTMANSSFQAYSFITRKKLKLDLSIVKLLGKGFIESGVIHGPVGCSQVDKL